MKEVLWKKHSATRLERRAAVLKVSERTIRNMIKAGTLHAAPVGAGAGRRATWRIPTWAVEDLLRGKEPKAKSRAR